jgi:hypothetical protein
MGSYVVKTNDVREVLGKMEALKGTAATFQYKQNLLNHLMEDEYRRIKWFFYCDDDEGNTIRVFDRRFIENFGGSLSASDKPLLLRGKGIGPEGKSPKTEMLGLFPDVKRKGEYPRHVTWEGGAETLAYFEELNGNQPTNEKQYWAGGFGETKKLEEFTHRNFWQFGYKDATKPAARKTQDYFERVRVGDEFAIKGLGGRNDLVIHYIGEVLEKTDDGILRLKRINRPLYKGKGLKGLNGATWFDTLVPITSQPIIDAIFHGEQSSNAVVDEVTETNSETRLTNLILCGPPGTGKTYQTIERSVKIVDPAFSGGHAAYKQRFDQLMREQRIAFITFHQSYSYEDFVEGIRPVLDQEGAEPRYECRAGIFKQLAVDALLDCLERVGTDPLTEGTYTDKQKAEIVQDFLTQDEHGAHRLKPESAWKRFVLIIDEINRGNISKILGELITLIEGDKRLRKGDNQNSLIVTLPYSGHKFAVPANLFLLATMNTADKSIALVDVALRRRFDFEELPVDLQVCKDLTDRMRSALMELNQRIVLRKDRDHRIGHAYFMNVRDDDTFNHTFRRQIIPLLQEYFYSDWDGLRYILGENSKPDGSFIRKTPNAAAPEVRTKWQWFFDAGTDDLNCLQTLCDNYGIA